ncbi:MAG: hypothetical protein IJX78_04580 [Bacilli bacterium]|nr:hypothetical protein [Bacilli bacterium]
MNFEKIKQIIKDNEIKMSIGTKQERTLHQYLKYYFCDNPDYHEQKCGSYIVDILKNEQIIEIQTSSFNAMRKKLESLLPNYPITIVYPIIVEKKIHNYDENGQFVSSKKSPKKEHPLKIGKELYKLNHILNNKNLNFICTILKIDEHRIPYLNRYKQKRMTRINQIPYELVENINLKEGNTLASLIPFDKEFTALEFKKKLKLSPRETSSTLIALRTLNVIKVTRQDGKKYIYEVIGKTPN